MARKPRAFVSGRPGPGEEALPAWLAPEGGTLNVEITHWLEPDLVVIEFVVTADGFRRPGGPLRVRWSGPDGDAVEARGAVVDELSSGVGPHVAGLIVRLAIRLESPHTWPAARDAMVEWDADGHHGAVHASRFRASLRIPAAPGSTDAGEDR